MAVLKEVENSYKSKAALKEVLNYVVKKSTVVEGGAVNPACAADGMMYSGGYSMLNVVKQYLNSYYPALVIRIV